jgi:hypothetical protein
MDERGVVSSVVPQDKREVGGEVRERGVATEEREGGLEVAYRHLPVYPT